MTTRWIYLHGFASGPGSTKAVFLRDRLAERGVDLRIPDLDLDESGNEAFHSLTISRILARLEREMEGGPGAVLIGSSLGGYAAALLASRDPRVEALVLLAPAFGFGRRFLSRIPGEVRAAGLFEVHHHAHRAPRTISVGILEDALRHPEEPRVACPTLILHGRHDDSVPVSLSQDFASTRPNVRLVVLEDDHALTTPGSLGEIERETLQFVLPWLPLG